MNRIVLNLTNLENKKVLDEKLQSRSLTKAGIVRQLFKKFSECTDETIDFLYK